MKTKTQFEIKIDNRKYAASAGKTILEVCLDNGIYIPNLCYDPRLKPQGACRLCVVQVQDLPEAVPACTTIISDGMSIKTSSEHLKELVKLNLELIISDHPLDCMTCEVCGRCALQDLAYFYGIKDTPYKGQIHDRKVLDDNPFIYRDNEKCILCGKCVRICDDLVGANAIGYAGRGFESEIVPAFEQSLLKTGCTFCGNCISTCPVGALQSKPYLNKARDWQASKIKTICPYCGVGCIINLHVKDNKVVCVTSDVGENLNQGSLCVKGRFGHDFINDSKRVSSPLARKSNGDFKKIGWDEAIKTVSFNLAEIIKKYGPDSIGILSSAKCTNEENFLMSKFARVAIGTNNIDHCARLCHASTVTGLIPTFGSGAMTNSIDDIKYSDAAIIIGSNTTEAHPVISYELIKSVTAGNLKLIVIDPRDIPITRYAAVHLKQKPGTDIAVLLGMMHVIYKKNLQSKAFINKRTEDFDNFKKCFKYYTPPMVAEISGVDENDLIKAAEIYGTANNASIFYAMGITQHTCGTDNVIAVADLAMMTGNIGRKGAGVNPLRGQNNVQGACDMGALPNYLSGYQLVEDSAAREKFEKIWGRKLPYKNGLTVTEMIEAASSGKIKALYIMGENPMLSEPDLIHVAQSLKNLQFLVVQDIFITETAEFADIILPGACFAEKDGTFTNTDRRIQRGRKALNPPGKAMADWEIICMISSALGYKMYYSNPSEIMDEIAGLTPIYGGVSFERIRDKGLQWPCRNSDDQGTSILHLENFTRGKGKFITVQYRPPAETPDGNYPLILTTGRILYQFHTRTMTGKSKGLNRIAPLNFVQINDEDAELFKIKDGDKVRIDSRRGSITAKASVSSKIKKGVIFVPFHYADSPANMLTNPQFDAKAKIPEFKACAAKIIKV